MNRPSPQTIKFGVLSSFIFIGSAVGIASLWPSTLSVGRAYAAQLVKEGGTAGGGEAEVDYRLATWLDPGNQAAYAGLARLQIATGQADEALTSLNRAGEGSDVEQLKVRTLIELGRTNQAADEASRLTGPGRSDDDLLLACFANALAGRPIDDGITSRLSSPEALQRVSRIKGGDLTLAQELFATGLLQSSSALLAKLPSSFESNLLLARIHFLRHTDADLDQAAELLNRAVSQNPANIEARHLLSNIYRAQNKYPDAQAQEAFIAKLQSGRL